MFWGGTRVQQACTSLALRLQLAFAILASPLPPCPYPLSVISLHYSRQSLKYTFHSLSFRFHLWSPKDTLMVAWYSMSWHSMRTNHLIFQWMSMKVMVMVVIKIKFCPPLYHCHCCLLNPERKYDTSHQFHNKGGGKVGFLPGWIQVIKRNLSNSIMGIWSI